MIKRICLTALAAAVLTTGTVIADGHEPQAKRQDLMKSVGKAAKPMGQMLRGDMAFDAQVLNESLEKFLYVSQQYGDLFPAGSESGYETEAAPAIWEDRAGFDEALGNWRSAVEKALAAQPATLEDAKPLAGGVFQTCKGCHDTYRIEND
ncbi:MAG: cytochrome c [Xanthomonadales bacterium]|nr:cytochrome c [Xanthomonadales bacterium]